MQNQRNLSQSTFFRALTCVITLGLLSACYVKEQHVVIPDAENMHFTSDGRLFVSGGSQFFELVAESDGYSAKVIESPKCAFTGITQIRDVLFVICNEKKLINAENALLALNLSSEEGKLEKVASLTGINLPNGMTTDGRNTLYIANTAYFGRGTLVKIEVEQDNPENILSIDKEWASEVENVFHPNGIFYIDNTLWFTDGGSIKRLSLGNEIQEGELGQAELFYHRNTIFDDLTPYCGGVIVTDYLGGRAMYIDEDGEKQYDTGIASFAGASSVLIGRAPLFNSNEAVITEKGILFDESSSIGNRLSTASFKFDLSSCQ
ncbi:hypothetical protein [Pleionea sediminis]|uniref:hypothetical protein n=1 Tax=Pleionea sediminis TaxID=2569479 RepID=UPI001185DEC9|nr:hypothetical protein [Pleionea sediminis]